MWRGCLCCRQDLGARLGELAAKLQALRDAFEAVQDLVDLPGLRVWHTQLQRVLSANLAAELRRSEPSSFAPFSCPLPFPSCHPE